MLRLLFGAKGRNIGRYEKAIRAYVGRFKKADSTLIAINSNTGRITYPSCVSDNGVSLYMNGIFTLCDSSLDEFLNKPGKILSSFLKLPVAEIPKQFANGAYVGLITSNRKIYLFNDFMGLAPVYYSFKGGVFFFSTDLRILAKIVGVRWDVEAICEYLQMGYNFTYKTILKDIYCLPPASLLCFDNEEPKIQRYASFPEQHETKAPIAEVAAEVKSVFRGSIKRLYSPKIQYALSLTGGMDSRLIFFEWPDRAHLFTETAGENSSDYLKAHELVRRLGNASLHQLEDLKDDNYHDGLRKYYDLCDNSTKLLDDYNYFHLMWKQQRGADIHLSGVGGELLGGESLYLNRKKLYIAKEAALPYTYSKLNDSDKPLLIRRALYANYKDILPSLLNRDFYAPLDDVASSVAKKLDCFLGSPCYVESYLERFRTFMLANAAFYPASFVGGRYFPIFPYNDRILINTISKYHPRVRELRRLELTMLKQYKEANDITVDTTHLKLKAPYQLHKLARVFRFVLNIGFHKRVPLLQKGDPPKFRAVKYFDNSLKEYRDYVRSTITECPFYDKMALNRYFGEVDLINKTNFFTYHRDAVNISVLFRLARAWQRLST